MENKKSQILGILLYVVCVIYICIDFLINEKYKELIIFGIFMLGIGLLFLIGIIFINITPKEIRRNKKRYEEIKKKSNKSAYEKLFMLAYQEKDEEIANIFKTNKVKELNDVGIYVYNNVITIMYRYKGFECEILVKSNEVTYRIDTPSKYDDIKANVEFEKEKKTNIDIKSINYDDLIEHIVDKVNLIKEEIATFVNINIVDNVFNGRMLKKIEFYTHNNKTYGLFLAIMGALSSLMIAFIGIGGSIGNDKFFGEGAEIIIGVFCFLLMLGFGLFGTILGVKMLLIYYRAKSDYQNKKIKTIKAKPRKVRLVKKGKDKGFEYFYMGIILYFDKLKVIIPLESYESKSSNADIKKFKVECLKTEGELTYLEKSKLVVNGGSKYISLARKYIFD